ncbi:PREDICTED: uncharacterized protein LOC105146903 [Acromyrmex echinatior]|uniref:uncharacterized protein LOC105146903 n=1 Tax=Acromyrmex echinatior TaxID=103372 RepID=UPI0005810A64|nr:PREDICTED: uncharacterized protein LOC105146903 [Acromyrmex echinatior]
MIGRLYFWIILFVLGVSAQENTYRSITSTLRECYENKDLLEKDNRLPHTLNTLIAILRKIENIESQNMDLRALTVAIMHRFRQDGIVKNPNVVEQSGVLPYKAGIQAQKYVQIIHFIPETTSRLLDDNIITDIERCTLHFMLSSSIEMYERGDENKVCRLTGPFRSVRSVISNYSLNTNLDMHDDVETLTPEQIDVITSNKDEITKHVFDANAMYSEFPPNHPKTARLVDKPLSSCPVENGVIKTAWGPVSAGPLIAGIAAGLQPEDVALSEIFSEDNAERRANLSNLTLDNKWIATITGDLAEVILMQGPTNNKDEKFVVGVDGNWNSSALPRWYFLTNNSKLQFTAAEIRGDIDGFILAREIEALFSKIPKLRLSQILDLYYSSRGLFNPTIRACNRKTLFENISSQISEQTFSASLVLEEYLHKATISDDKMENFATQATEQLASYVNSMDNDLSCNKTGNFDVTQIAIDLTIIIDITWSFNEIQSIIANILDKIDINQYNSQFTIINGHDGSIILNTTNSILDFGLYNINNYTNNVTNGINFDLPKSFDKLWVLQKKKLNDTRYDLGNVKSDVVLIIPYTSSISSSDKEYCIQQIKNMREQVPDTTLFILTYGSIDRWTDLISSTNLFTVQTTAGDIGNSATITKLISRIKQVPQRLINTQCGENYVSVGKSNSFINYIEPNSVVFYRMHPNYFFSTESDHVSKITIHSDDNLKVCKSRRFQNINETNDCVSINNNAYTIEFSCGDAGLIHLCDPLHLLISANSSTINFKYGPDECRFPHMIKYTISYENLVCESNANINMLNIFILVISMIYTFL